MEGALYGISLANQVIINKIEIILLVQANINENCNCLLFSFQFGLICCSFLWKSPDFCEHMEKSNNFIPTNLAKNELVQCAFDSDTE